MTPEEGAGRHLETSVTARAAADEECVVGTAPTGVYLTTVFAFVLGLVMLVPQRRAGVPGSTVALIAAGLGAIAEMIVVGTLSSWWPQTPGLFVASVGLCATALLFWAALGLVLDRPVPRWALAAFGIAVVVLAAVLLLTGASSDLRTLTNSAGSAVIFAAIAATVPLRSRTIPYGAVLVGVVAWLAVAVRLVRAGVFAVYVVDGDRAGDASSTNTVSAWLISLIVPVLLVGLALIGQQRMVNDQAALAATDFLTGTLNRRAWTQAVAELRRDTRSDITVLFVDLDHFKDINDQVGHDGGDRTLRHVAQVLAPLLHPGELLGRFGGEEFVVAIPGHAEQRARQLGEEALHKLAASSLLYAGTRLRVTFSAGVAVSGADEPLEAALQRADAAMYEAKAGGRGRLVVAGEDAGDPTALSER